MKRLSIYFAALLLTGVALPAAAATLTVTTDVDEANCNVNGSSPNPSCDISANPQSYPLSKGCSLREALQDIADKGNNPALPVSYPECGTPDSGAGSSNTIVLGAHAIVLYSSVPDPNDSTGAGMINNSAMAFIGDKATYGSLSITGGDLSCVYSASPSIGGFSMLHMSAGSDLSVSGTHFHNCTVGGDGGAIVNDDSGAGDLNLAGVTFGSVTPGDGIRIINQGNGGCIRHGSGNLSITGASFTQCEVDDGTALPGSGHGNGGAIYIGNVGNAQKVAISGATFQANIAGDNGGAIYLSGTDAIAIDTTAFQGNIANGNTNSENNAELGGGAIYATGTATGTNDGSGGLNASAFLLFQDSFIGNLAPKGTGGAILLTSGNLTYGTLTINLGEYQLGKVDGIPGGIVASNFSGNIAGGTSADVPVDPRAGSGGALYANAGKVSVFSSSFVGSNTSQNASGGAIAYNDAGDSQSPLAISNTTFNGNSASLDGGAIANLISKFTSNAGKVTLINDTISGNSAGAGGGGAFYNGNSSAAEVLVSNTIFDNSSAGGNCAGSAFTDVAGNLQHNPSSGCSGIANTGDPALQGAAPFGGINALVFVMQLNAGSAASGTGDQPTCTASPIFNLDEALNSRPKGKPNCDVGAFESGIVPDLTITKSHTDPFKQGDVGDTYTITVTNSGNDSTTGTVTVTDNLPAGLTATGFGGTGWTGCTATPVVGPNTLTCSRSDVLASGSSYQPITVTVDVSASAGTPLTNTAIVSGGGESDTSNDTANDLTNVVPPPDLTVIKSHSGNFTPGQVGATFTITVSNVGGSATSGTVTLTDNLPAGLTATGFGGTGWTGCTATPVVGPNPLTCTRSDPLANGSAYPPITLTVTVAAAPPAQATNSVDVSGGGEVNTSNDHFDDLTTLPVRLQSFDVE